MSHNTVRRERLESRWFSGEACERIRCTTTATLLRVLAAAGAIVVLLTACEAL